MINEKGVLKVYEKILRHKKKVNISIESKRIAKIFDYNSKVVYDIIKKKATEEFREEEHPRDEDGKFADKGGGSTSDNDKQVPFFYKQLKDFPEDSDYKKEQRKRHREDKDGNWYEWDWIVDEEGNVVDEDDLDNLNKDGFFKSFETGHATNTPYGDQDDLAKDYMFVSKYKIEGKYSYGKDGEHEGKHKDYVGYENRYYDKNGKLARVVTYDKNLDDRFPVSDKRLDENGELTEVKLTKEDGTLDYDKIKEETERALKTYVYFYDKEQYGKNKESIEKLEAKYKKKSQHWFANPNQPENDDVEEFNMSQYAEIKANAELGKENTKEQKEFIAKVGRIKDRLKEELSNGLKPHTWHDDTKKKIYSIDMGKEVEPVSGSGKMKFDKDGNYIRANQEGFDEEKLTDDIVIGYWNNKLDLKHAVEFAKHNQKIEKLKEENIAMLFGGANDAHEMGDDLLTLYQELDYKQHTIRNPAVGQGIIPHPYGYDEDGNAKPNKYGSFLTPREFAMHKMLGELIDRDKAVKGYGNISDEKKTNKHWKAKVKELSMRVDNEILTPLVAERQHIYKIDERPSGGKAGKGMLVNSEAMERVYEHARKNQNKNTWTQSTMGAGLTIGNIEQLGLVKGHSGGKNRMHFEVHAKKGYKTKHGIIAGDWSADKGTIRVFNTAGSDAVQNVDWIFNHEFAHSQWTVLEQMYGDEKGRFAGNIIKKLGRPSKKQVALKEFKKDIAKMTYTFALKHLGSYFAGYIKDFKEDPDTGWGANMFTEAFSALTDAKDNKRKGHGGYRSVTYYFPDIIRNYEILKGKDDIPEDLQIDEDWLLTAEDEEEFKKETKDLRELQGESLSNVDNDIHSRRIFFLNSSYDIVDEEKATMTFVNGYNKRGTLVEKARYVPENPIVTEAEFKEEDHPRGQPDNKGQFVSKGGGSSKDAIHGEKEKVEKYENTLDIKPKKEEVEKAVNIESKVIGGVFDFIKDKNYKNKVKWVETQGSFAKGTDLGSSDLDIFIGFDYSLSLKEIEEITLDIGKNVLEPISDTNKYKIKHGADKDYPESNVDNVEVQIIGTSDVTLDQIKKGFEDGGMKTATDRTPHHTRYMKKALKGKENEVRKVKKFFKEAGVYDSSIAKQGFSGFATEVLVDKLGSFSKVVGFFANFVKGKVIGDTDRKFDTPLVMVDPLDPNRNLAQAFSHSEKDGNIAPNKNLARLVKTARSLFKTGKLPEITKEKIPSLSVKFHVDNTIDNNEIYGELYSSALKMSATLKRNGYAVKTPKDRIAEDFTIDVPRINVDYDENTGEATLNFGLENFDKKKRYVGGIPEDFPKEKLQAFYDNHKGEKLVRKDGKLYAEQENEYPTAEKLMKAIVSREKKNASVGKLEEFIKQAVVTQVDKEYENITDKPSVTEAGTSAGAKKGWDKRGRGRKQRIPSLNPRKRNPTNIKLRKRDSPMKIQTKTRRHDPTSKALRKPEDFVGKQFIIKADLVARYPEWAKEVGIEFIEEQIKRADTEWDSYDLFGREVKDTLQFMVRKRGGTVTYRAKATISTVEKLARAYMDKKKNYKSIDDLKDKTGLRVVLEDNKDVKATVKMIQSYYSEKTGNPISVIESKDYVESGHPDKSGYRGIHLIFKDSERGMLGEIQIRTKRQNFWAEVFHLSYKSEIPEVRDIYEENSKEIKGFGNGLSSFFFEQDNLTRGEINTGKRVGKMPPYPKVFDVIRKKSKLFAKFFEPLRHQYELEDVDEEEISQYKGEANVEVSRSIFDDMLDEIDEMTPEMGFNVCLLDDYASEGEMLTLVGNYDTIENANYIKKECEKQGQEAYIYPSKELNTNEDIEEEDVQKLAENLLEAEKTMVEKASKKFKNMP